MFPNGVLVEEASDDDVPPSTPSQPSAPHSEVTPSQNTPVALDVPDVTSPSNHYDASIEPSETPPDWNGDSSSEDSCEVQHNTPSQVESPDQSVVSPFDLFQQYEPDEAVQEEQNPVHVPPAFSTRFP